MNICFVCDEYPPVSHGGIGTITRSLAEEMVKEGHSVFVVGLLPRSYGGLEQETVNGVHVWRVRHGIKLPFLSRKNLLYRLINKLINLDFMFFSVAWRKHIKLIENLVEDQNINIVEFPDYRMAFSQSRMKRFEWPNIKIPKVVKFHGSTNYFNIETGKEINQGVYKHEIELYNYADSFISVSEYTKSKMLEYYYLNKKIKVIYNGLEIIDHTGKNDKDEVVFSGSLLDKKGIIPLLMAWNDVCDKNDKLILKLYGKGVKEFYVKHIKRQHRHRVKFMGHTSKAELIEAYSNAKLAVFPSFAEAFALAPMESMMIGCPTIYSCLSSGKELAQNDNSIKLIDPHFPKTISDVILFLISNDKNRIEIGLNGRQLIKDNFNINKIVDQHLDFYRHIITSENL